MVRYRMLRQVAPTFGFSRSWRRVGVPLRNAPVRASCVKVLERGAPRARVAVAVLAAVAVLSHAARADASFPGRNGRLATSYSIGCSTAVIATMRADGSAVRRLTECFGADQQQAFEPDWSPDGRRIVFLRTSYLNPGRIAVMNADGSGRYDVALTGLQPIPPIDPDAAPLISAPSFSPDGRRFVYTRSYPDDVWQAAIDGSEDRKLRRGSAPLWSPSGRSIVYTRWPLATVPPNIPRGGTWLMDPETGERIRRIARRSLRVLDWSPDGRRVLYVNLPGTGGHPGLHVMRADGSHKRRVRTYVKAHEYDAAFSPDGRQIAFSGTRALAGENEQDGIWVMTTRSRRARQIFAGNVTTEENRTTSPPSLSWQARTRRGDSR